MLFIPGSSISSAAAQDYEIPGWIMNNAGWWADGAIDDSSFLKGIEYLLDNLIIQIPSNREITSGSGLLQLDKFAYELPKRSGTTAVNISGEFENWAGHQVSIEIVRPDGKTDNISTRSSTGEFKIAYSIKSDFPLGNYQLSAKNVMNVKLGVLSFKLNAYTDKDDKSIPAWVKNNAGWWADGGIDDGSFVSGLQFLVKEGIIKVQYKKVDKDTSFAPGIEESLIMYQTKIPPNAEPFSVIVVHVTHNDYCTDEENKITAAYGKMAEYGFKKNTRSNPTQVLAVCMKLDEIKGNSYPLVLRELGANKANVMVFIGDVKANFESYIIYNAVGWWTCQADYTSDLAFKGCDTHIIVVCDECIRPDAPDHEDVTARGMETLVHEIGHHNMFEVNFGRTVYGGSLHNAQNEIDYCYEGGVLGSTMCKNLVESVPIMGTKYPVMNLNFLKNSWKEIDRIAEGDKITNWFDCKISNFKTGITGNCVDFDGIQKLADEYWDCSIGYPVTSPTCIEFDKDKYTVGGIEESTSISEYWVGNSAETGINSCDIDCNLSLYYENDVHAKLEKFQDEDLHQQLFDMYVSITPKQILDEVVSFHIYTDDYVGEAALVDRDVDYPLKFWLGIDPLDIVPLAGPIDEMYYKATIIHENAHILSLSSSQADNDGIPNVGPLYEEPYTELRKIVQEKEATCAPNYYNDIPGCMNDNSYLNLFFQKFWADIYPSFKWYYELDDYDKFLDHNALFYKKHSTQFVTEYSASNPDEDFAESFTLFVLKGKPTKSTIAEQKILFFYDFPELVEMRDFIRSNL